VAAVAIVTARNPRPGSSRRARWPGRQLDRDHVSVLLLDDDGSWGDHSDHAAVDPVVLGAGRRLHEHLGADHPLAEELIDHGSRQRKAARRQPEEHVERDERNGEQHEAPAIHGHMIVPLADGRVRHW
jgi:hypothetical protein